VEEWLVWRFHHAVDVGLFLDHVDSTLAWQIDWRYRDQRLLKGLTTEKTRIREVLGEGIRIVRLATDDRMQEHPGAAWEQSLSLIRILRHELSKTERKPFSVWLGWALSRAAKLDPRPRKTPKRKDFEDGGAYRAALRSTIFGHPLPREALDPETDYNPARRVEFLSRFLEGLDWQENPFLRSPDDMKKLGFKGVPYKL
jgi:hypothetical protein